MTAKAPIPPIAADPESPLWSWDWLKRAPGEVANTLMAIASRNKWDVNALAGIIQLESGGDPHAINRYSNATGLIQWMPETALVYGTTTAAIYRMNQVEQLELAERYWANAYKPIPKEVGDYYMGVFSPKYMGVSDDTIIARKGQNKYDQNPGLDWTKDEVLTTGDVRSVFRNYYRNHEKSGALVVPPVTKRRGKAILWLGITVTVGIIVYKTLHPSEESRGSNG